MAGVANENYYVTLSVARNATLGDIKRAYWKLAKEIHPDANPDDPKGMQFMKLRQAYEVLSDPQKRCTYDKALLKVDVPEEAASTPHDQAPTKIPPSTAKPDGSSLLPPVLSRTEVEFRSIEQGDGTIGQITVIVSNPNKGRILRPFLRPERGSFWQAHLFENGGSSGFVIQTVSPEQLEPGTYTHSVEVHWAGAHGVMTMLPVSLTVRPGNVDVTSGKDVSDSQHPSRTANLVADEDVKLASRMLLGVAVFCLIGPAVTASLVPILVVQVFCAFWFIGFPVAAYKAWEMRR